MNLSLRISADNVTIDGVQFVGDNVVAPGAVDGLTIVNCKVTNNKFDGFVRPENVIVEQTNVSFNNNLVEEHNGGRVIYLYCTNGLTVKGNSFAGALLCDAIRAQTYLAGTVVISDNKCTATTQSFIMVMGVKGIDALIENNYVEDIKSTIIDFRTMKEADAAAKFNIRYNTFKNSGKAWCPIRIRTAGYAAGNTIEVNVSDNKFIESYCVDGGKTYMFENPSYSSQTDPFKKIYTIGKNYYVIDGKVLTELTDELVDNSAISYDEPYATEEEVGKKVLTKAVVVSINTSKMGYNNQQAVTEIKNEGITITFGKGTNSNAPIYYNSGNAIRMYGSNTMTITGGTITKLVITFGEKDGTNAITVNDEAFTGTWEGKAESLLLKIGGTKGNRRIATITVYAEVAA